MAAGWTRRAVVSSALAALSPRGASGKGVTLRPERVQFSDPSTEFPVYRLTSPEHSCLLPPPPARAISRRDAFFVFWSDRSGSPQAYRMDQRSGQAVQLTQASDLDGRSLALLPDDRGLLYFDGPSLRYLALSNLRDRELCRVGDGWRRGAGFSVAPDGSRALWVETREGGSRICALSLPKGAPQTVFESGAPLSFPVARPAHPDVLYRREEGSLWLAGRERPLALAAGRIGQAFWSADGGVLVYLSFPEKKSELNAIREADPASDADRLVASTSQYAAFAPNGDASVFVGASASRASPHVILMLRITRRELPICEHRASDPARVAPVFSPDSQRVYFQSDRHGKPAIYSVAVERLVEPTE
jgi:oligogalacturonide lyase